MAYVDDKHIAFFSTGLLPKTAAGTEPEPADVRHRGLRLERLTLAENEHPHEVRPGNSACC